MLDLKTIHLWKYSIAHPPLDVEYIVLIEGMLKHKFLWKFGRIQKAIPGMDGNVQKYKLKTEN